MTSGARGLSLRREARSHDHIVRRGCENRLMDTRFGQGLLFACLCACAASGCTHAVAKTAPSPPLDMPAPPPRDIEPAAPAIADAPALPTPPAQEPPRGTPQRPAPPREQPRVDPPRPSAPARPPATLQTSPATADEDLERGIRATLARASADLDRVDYRRLGADARTQYDTAKRFILQADEAAHAKNLVFAKNLADKAYALATQLLGK